MNLNPWNKTGTGIQILIRLPVFLVQVKTRNNFKKLQVMIIMKDKMIVIREPKTFHFKFDLPKDVERNWKHEIELIIKHNKSLAEH